MNEPIINFTIPTFNRLELTKKCLFSLHKYTHIPHVVTVVDNNSTDGTPDFLLKMRDEGLITNLFLLEKNMGVSCASNFGFDATPTPLYMKLDNDMEILRNNWINDIVALWAENPEVAIMGPKLNPDPAKYCSVKLKSGTTVLTNLTNLPGAATIISRDVFDRLGYWNEDYGLYGEEDADYSHRAKLANYLLVSFEAEPVVRHLGVPEATPGEYVAYKTEQRNKNISPRRLVNKFALYCYLYDKKIIGLFRPRRYVPELLDNCRTTFTVSEKFLKMKSFAEKCRRIINNTLETHPPDVLHSPDFVRQLLFLKQRMGVEE